MILIDSRVGSVELAPLITAPSITCTLEYADFAWAGHGPDGQVDVGVERKTLPDLISSMTTGRLSGHQMIGLTQNYSWVYILVEGIWKPDPTTGVLMSLGGRGAWTPVTQGSRQFMARDIYNFLNSLHVMCGAVVVTTSGRAESAKWLDSCHGWWSREWHSHKSHKQYHTPTAPVVLVKPNTVVRVANQLVEGIGWERAKALGEKFKTVRELVSASYADFLMVPGIGKALAEKLHAAVAGEGDLYVRNTTLAHLMNLRDKMRNKQGGA